MRLLLGLLLIVIFEGAVIIVCAINHLAFIFDFVAHGPAFARRQLRLGEFL